MITPANLPCKTSNSNFSQHRGFTLVELLVVIAIIGILTGMLLPAVQHVRESARRSACSNNLRQMAMATKAYYSTFSRFPPGCQLDRGVSWGTYILPHIEQESVFDLVSVNDDAFKWTSGDGEVASSTFMSIFRCASDPVPNHVDSRFVPLRVPSSYIAVSSGTIPVDPNDNTYENLEWVSGNSQALVESMRSGVLTATQDNFPTKVTTSDVKDGESNTALIGECIFDTSLPIAGSVTLNSDHWCVGSYDIDRRGGTGGTSSGNAQDESEFLGSTGIPVNFYHSSQSLTSISFLQGQQISFGFASWHSGNTSNFAYADGSVQLIPATIDPLVYSQLGQRADGQVQKEF